MATSRTRWLLSILLVNLQDCFALAGPPAPPSRPHCYIPCTEGGCSADIHCSWDPGPDPQISTNYSLHWQRGNNQVGYVPSLTKVNSSIQRMHYGNHEDLRVWVEAKNQHGSVKSEENSFDTALIKKPPPPEITSTEPEPLEIEWDSHCNKLELSMGTCEVQNRIKAQPPWHKYDKLHHTFTLNDLQPATVYEIQVRCTCSTSLASDWSAVKEVTSAEMAPVGVLDVWRDCGSPESFDCVLTWKRLPISQARGLILEYKVRLLYSDSTDTTVNVSATEPSSQLTCNDMQCHLSLSLKDVSSVNVSAINAHGATVPSHLTLLKPGKEKKEHDINLTMDKENLNVTWVLPSQLSDDFKEYVVQYKQAGHPRGQGFDWTKVSSHKTAVSFKGQFQEYTPYLVSLLAVSQDLKVYQLASVIGYSVEGTPSKVPSFQTLSIAATQVILTWEPVPLSTRRGVILYYQIGRDTQNVHNVSASPFKMNNLNPDQDYEVWIRAVTKAGPGESMTTRFKTTQLEHHVIVIGVVMVVVALVLVVMCLSVVLHCFSTQQHKVCQVLPAFVYDKVPDPSNSHIFRQMKHQINEPLAWFCIPNHEPLPNISVLEVVEIMPGALMSSRKKDADPERLTDPVMEDRCSQMDCQDDEGESGVTEESGKMNHRYGREEYSKMVDSDEEKDRGDCWSSSEEDQFTSGYEKHFMPTPIEVLEG